MYLYISVTGSTNVLTLSISLNKYICDSKQNGSILKKKLILLLYTVLYNHTYDVSQNTKINRRLTSNNKTFVFFVSSSKS